ncbi:MAG TPA: hypothetical protein VMF09_15835 [Solirubrobacteraceae bacterium]|nr:hypothetical protein [Solirubrobacteraceae bacterium]
MTTKERLHQLVDTLSDREAEDALRLLDAELEAQAKVEHHDETEIAALPEGWGTTLTGEPMPDVVAAVRRSRATH